MLQIHATHLDFLAHRPHTCYVWAYVCSTPGLSASTGDLFFCQIYQPGRSSSGCALTFDREEFRSPCPEDGDLNPNLFSGWDECSPRLRRARCRHVLSEETHGDVSRQDCQLPKLFNRGLIWTIVSMETKLTHIRTPDRQPPKHQSLAFCLLMDQLLLRHAEFAPTHPPTHTDPPPLSFHLLARSSTHFLPSLYKR